MMTDTSSAWLWLFGLGAVHGLNPGMGWLFAVALGLQERSARAVWRALLPLAAGHALAIGLAVVLAAALGLVVPAGVLKWLVAAALLGFAIFKLAGARHPHWGGMRVGMRDLAVWSLLMASAHGAGLMVLPILLKGEAAGLPAVHAATEDDGHHHGHHAAATATQTTGPTSRVSGLAAMTVHSLGYLLVTGIIAVVVYTWAGLRLLRAAWINLDLIWAVALVVTAVVTPFL